MGIDVYLRWKDQTQEERESQYTGFRTDKGDVGYLREAYHGGPYVTRILAPEAFKSAGGTAEIPAAVLRERLPDALEAAKRRLKVVYNIQEDDEEWDATLQSFADFVRLAEKKEAETGEVCTILASY